MERKPLPIIQNISQANKPKQNLIKNKENQFT